jgi:hypothetical protein
MEEYIEIKMQDPHKVDIMLDIIENSQHLRQDIRLMGEYLSCNIKAVSNTLLT